MHPKGEDGAEQIYLFSNHTMTSPGYDDILYLRIPKEMLAVAGDIEGASVDGPCNQIGGCVDVK